MRLHLTLTPNTEPVPFNYQHQLTGALHKWLGQNDLHDKISLYSFSWLRGRGNPTKEGLSFPQGVSWFISFWENTYGSELIQGIVEEPKVMYGMKVDEVRIVRSPEFGQKERFKVSSPVLIRKNMDDQRRKHLTFQDEDAGGYLTRTLKTKLREAGISDEGLQVEFDKQYDRARTKLMDIKGTKLKVNLCPVVIQGNPKAIEFAWNVGIGELTGSGFGALC